MSKGVRREDGFVSPVDGGSQPVVIDRRVYITYMLGSDIDRASLQSIVVDSGHPSTRVCVIMDIVYVWMRPG